MLSKADLKSIENIVKKSEERIKTELRSEFKYELKNETAKICRELKSLRGSLNVAIKFLDNKYLKIKHQLGT